MYAIDLLITVLQSLGCTVIDYRFTDDLGVDVPHLHRSAVRRCCGALRWGRTIGPVHGNVSRVAMP
jgi:hypothetical protein